MSVIRLSNGVKQSNQESETISLFYVDPPCVRNRVYIESFRRTDRSTRSFGCEQRGIIDYVWIRTARRRHQGASSKLQSALPSIDNKREKERWRKKAQYAASARTAESSSLGLSRESRVRTGRCTYANGKVAIKILRKRYHAACRAGAAFILARRAQCDCWAS